MRLPPCLKLAASLVLALGTAPAFAAIVSVDTDTTSPTTAQANGTIAPLGQRTVNILFEHSVANESVASVSGTLNYNTANFNVTSSNASCSVNDAAGTIPFIRVDFNGLADDTVICTLTFTNTAGADGAVEPLTITDISPPATTVNNGQLTIQAAPANPPTINFAPTTVNIPSGGAPGATSQAAAIAVTAVGGAAPDTGSYNCTVPAGFQVTNSSNPSIVAGSDPADMSVTCTLGAAATQATMTCARTGAAVTPVDITLNCPAGVVSSPAFTGNPTAGTTLTCNGSPGSTTVTQATITNSGNANATGVSCNVVGAGFAIQTQPAATINTGASSTVVVACTVPADGVTNSGTLTCTSGNGATIAYPVASTGIATPVGPTVPATIPSTSLWAKIGLIGLLAALGMLVVGFRRHH